MGRPSPESKKAIRARQKVRRKLFSSNSITQHQIQNSQDSQTTNQQVTNQQAPCTCANIGDVDIDHIEMSLYDSYREMDGEAHSESFHSTSAVMNSSPENVYTPPSVNQS